MRVVVEAADADVQSRVARVRLVAFDFDGVFTDNFVYVSQQGVETVRCWRSDGLGLQNLRAAGIKSIIVSTETNEVVNARGRKLRIDCYSGCERKVEKLQEVVDSLGLAMSEVAFVGNDITDAECLRVVAVPIIVQDAHPDVRGLALLQTETPGGRGAVREVCDFLVAQRAARQP